MTQEPQEQPESPQPGTNGVPAPPPAAPAPPPQWGQYAPPPGGQPPAPPQWGQPPAPPQWGQYAPPPGGTGYAGGPVPPGYGHYMAPPKPGVIPLRPLGLGEVLDGAFQSARRNGKAMFGSALIFQSISAAITGVILVLALTRFNLDILSSDFSGSSAFSQSDLDNLANMALGFGTSLLLAVFLQTIAQMVLQGVLVIPVLRAVLNRRTSFGDMWRLARPRIGRLLLLALLYVGVEVALVGLFALVVFGLYQAIGGVGIGLAVVLGLAGLVAAVWVGTKVLLAPAAIIVEDVGVFAGIGRSWSLTTRNWWRTFGISALAAIIASVISGIISTPIALLMGLITQISVPNPTPDQLMTQLILTQVTSAVVASLVGAVTLAFQAGVMALIYVDLRMRRDGFDVTLLKESESGADDGGIPGRGAPRHSPTEYPGQDPSGGR
ncbi:hypothetical protein [Specibacter sp. RAF43]|uniref:hypothetical protein n=1 Tax=Specibacter sp. RAF43 TaxID=3233057 RepID=UPI003F992DE3